MKLKEYNPYNCISDNNPFYVDLCYDAECCYPRFSVKICKDQEFYQNLTLFHFVFYKEEGIDTIFVVRSKHNKDWESLSGQELKKHFTSLLEQRKEILHKVEYESEDEVECKSWDEVECKSGDKVLYRSEYEDLCVECLSILEKASFIDSKGILHSQCVSRGSFVSFKEFSNTKSEEAIHTMHRDMDTSDVKYFIK